MQVTFLARQEVDDFLTPLQLSLGGWNEVVDLSGEQGPGLVVHPPKDADELFWFVEDVVGWCYAEGRVLLQVDNSTAFLSGEDALFADLLGLRQLVDLAAAKSFTLELDSGPAREMRFHAAVKKIVYFSLVLKWHLYLVFEERAGVRYLSLQDGIVYLFERAPETNLR